MTRAELSAITPKRRNRIISQSVSIQWSQVNQCDQALLVDGVWWIFSDFMGFRLMSIRRRSFPAPHLRELE
jgi:hypothetical protein